MSVKKHLILSERIRVENRFNPNKKYLINNKFGNHYTYGSYQNGNWQTVINKLRPQLNPHDCRYTFASLADNAGTNEVALKLIMGRSIQDVTKGVCTEKTPAELLIEVNKI